ncbi:AAA family ATPase [Microcoleus sp. F4-D5]|uniref:AAA family ATPase n=1 Tax=Microcoleus sp. F4-D5 TaxID=2818760 RepID=UPI002FD0A84A
MADLKNYLLGYEIAEQIYAGNRTLVYRGLRSWDGQPVAIKLLRNDFPSFNELVHFRNQYVIAKNLDIPGTVKIYSLERYHNHYALIMEDFGGISLTGYLATLAAASSEPLESLPINEFLPIAIQIASALDELARHRVIHKDLKPANILINPVSKQVKLIDFSIASLLPRETQEIHNPNLLEGTLPYISPEQTGRMNRGIDYRTDFYSLGVSFYELLTGQLPFVSDDPMDLIYCHLAKQPISVNRLNQNIPAAICDIVSKLMAKNAEGRYQSALGLKHDLEICLSQWQKTGEIASFKLGQRDLCDRFQIPEKLYGREPELATLLAAFDRVGQGSTELMLVAGFSGIGKTSVIHEVHKPIVRQRGYFIQGKFDQFQRDIPFSAFVQACRDLMGQLLIESNAQLKQWQTKILNALGENAQVIIDVIPELEQIIGPQLLVPELSGNAAQNRFNLLFQKFIQVFTAPEHPLVIFLDDLQWADSASLNLMQVLMSDVESIYLLLIGAYRDNEVSPAHLLIQTIENIGKAGAAINSITLAPLNLQALNQMVADTLSCNSSLANPLTQLIYQKTKGNPFFSSQFLKTLHEENLISFNRERGYWECNIAQVKALALTDDVVEFMAARLQKLPTRTQAVLKLAACIGNQFNLSTLALLLEQSLADTAAALWRALQEELVLPQSDIYKFFQEQTALDNSNNPELSVPYKFLHDRVQQAAYSLIPEDQKKATHLKIGQRLLNNTAQVALEEKIFDIVNQLNIGLEFITNPAEKDQLVQLNLIAGKKAKSATAYEAAVKYLTVGLELLTENCWQSHYDMTLALYIEAAEAEYLNINFERSAMLAETALQNATNLLDAVKVYELQMLICIGQLEMIKAVDIGLEILQKLDVYFVTLEGDDSLIVDVPKLADLENIPAMTDPYKLSAMRILKILCAPVFMAKPEIFPPLIVTMVNLCIDCGNSALSAFAYGFYGLLLSGVGKMDAGYHAGTIALKLLEKFNAKELKAKVYNLFNSNIRSWKEHANNSVIPLQEGVQSGLETGDIEWGGYCAANFCSYLFFTEKNLDLIVQQQAVYIDLCIKIKQQIPIHFSQVWRQLGLNLQGEAADKFLLRGASFDETETLPRLIEAKSGTVLFIFYVAKAILSYHFKDYDLALKNAVLANEQAGAAFGFMQVAILNFYHSLTLLARYDRASPSEQQQYLQQIQVNQEKMKDWSHHAPMNYLHKFELVQAELYRVQGSALEAMDYYDRAIAGAKENTYLNEEALANELAAKFYLEWGKEKIARSYLIDAYYAYARWGAKAKIDDLEQHYPHLFYWLDRQPQINNYSTYQQNPVTDKQPSSIGLNLLKGNTNTTKLTKSLLDLTTVIKASQAISSEIVLDKLLAKLMNLLMENAGATKGSLILLQEGQLLVAAEALVEYQTAAIPEVDSLVQKRNLTPHRLPLTVIYYVERTRTDVVLSNAVTEKQFATESYISSNQIKSLLCTPILTQSKLIGILYLENNLTTDAFTPHRLEILRLLCSQAAISIENARLYEQQEENSRTLEQRVNERMQELQQEISDRKKAELALQQAKEAADAANKAKSEFLANMSHELRTPLNAILGFTQLMNRDSSLNQQQQENLGIITRSGEHLLSLINDVLEMSKIEAGRLTLNENSFDLYHLLDSLEEMLQLKVSSKGLQLIFERADDVPQYLKTDASKLRQVLINLLGNAIKFTQKGHIILRVIKQEPPQLNPSNLFLENHKTLRLLFEIEDTGFGIAAEEMDSLFEAFVQTEVGRKYHQGTGLGLPISRKFVQLMGGDITASSQLGKGTILQFDIQTHLAEENELRTTQLSRRVIGLEPNSKVYRILVVDDRPENRLLLLKLLMPLGFEVRDAENGAEAVALWSSWKPHLIWMDMRMPVMDGYEATKQIKSHLNGQPTIIIALTASAFEEERSIVLSAGCDDFVSKPYRDEVIFEKMYKYLGVRYVYEEPVLANSQGQKLEQPLMQNSLSVQENLLAMPAEWLTQLHQAATQLDAEMILKLVAEIPVNYASLVNTLIDWVNDFRFDKITNLIENLTK